MGLLIFEREKSRRAFIIKPMQSPCCFFFTVLSKKKTIVNRDSHAVSNIKKMGVIFRSGGMILKLDTCAANRTRAD